MFQNWNRFRCRRVGEGVTLQLRRREIPICFDIDLHNFSGFSCFLYPLSAMHMIFRWGEFTWTDRCPESILPILLFKMMEQNSNQEGVPITQYSVTEFLSYQVGLILWQINRCMSGFSTVWPCDNFKTIQSYVLWKKINLNIKQCFLVLKSNNY